MTIKRVWCTCCIDKKPPEIKEAAFLVPVRKRPYDFIYGTVVIDKRLYGVCAECLTTLSDFKQKNSQEMDKNNPNLIYSKCG